MGTGLRASVAEHRSAAARYNGLADGDQAKLDAVLVLLGEAPAPQQPATPAAPSPQSLSLGEGVGVRSSWTDLIYAALEGLNGGLTHQEIIATAAGTVYAERFVKSPNAFYARVGKLEKTGKLKRRGKVLYLPDVLKRIDAGEIIEDPPRDHEATAGGMAVLIRRVLDANPQGLKAGEVLAKLREVPDALERVNRNPQVVYSTLGRMVQAKLAARDYRDLYTAYGVEPSAESPTLRALWAPGAKPM